MSSAGESKARRLRKELSQLQEAVAKEMGKASKANAAAAKARQRAADARSDSTRRSKLREADRKEREALEAQKRQADIQSKIATKTKDLHQSEQGVADSRARAARALEDELRRQQRAQRDQLLQRLDAIRPGSPELRHARDYDFFVSHAGSDKEQVARPLAEALKARGAEVFLDEWEIRVGDSLREKIDDGLRRSRFGVVILSQSFLAGRTWTDRELNGLFALEEQGEPRILPVWHDVTKSQVAEYSPILADRAALKTADFTIGEIADLLVDRLGTDAR